VQDGARIERVEEVVTDRQEQHRERLIEVDQPLNLG
jgi:hypothetical protein